MTIQILGTGCSNCNKLEQRTKEAVEKLGLDVNIEKVTELEKIIAADIMAAPGLIIDGKTASVGRVLSVKELMKIIKSSQSKQNCCGESCC